MPGMATVRCKAMNMYIYLELQLTAYTHHTLSNNTGCSYDAVVSVELMLLEVEKHLPVQRGDGLRRAVVRVAEGGVVVGGHLCRVF